MRKNWAILKISFGLLKQHVECLPVRYSRSYFLVFILFIAVIEWILDTGCGIFPFISNCIPENNSKEQSATVCVSVTPVNASLSSALISEKEVKQSVDCAGVVNNFTSRIILSDSISSPEASGCCVSSSEFVGQVEVLPPPDIVISPILASRDESNPVKIKLE
jgi:hypothetical protein